MLVKHTCTVSLQEIDAMKFRMDLFERSCADLARAEQLAGWVAHPPVRVITNTPAQQAEINDHAGVAENVFYESSSLVLIPGLTVKADHPCLGAAEQKREFNADRSVEPRWGISFGSPDPYGSPKSAGVGL
jgi:hypothetical protein